MMAFFKKKFDFKKVFIIFISCVGAMFCVSGCVSKPEWVFRSENAVISSGEYVELMVDNLMGARKQMGNSSKDSKHFFDGLRNGKIGSLSGFEWVEQETKKNAKQLLLLKNEFEKKNIQDFSKRGLIKSYFKKRLNRNFDNDFYDADAKIAAQKVGLDKKAFIDGAINECRNYAVFMNMFGKGRPRYISEERYDEFTRQNFMKFKMIRIPKNVEDPVYSEVNDPKSGSKLEKKAGVKTPRELVEKYMKQIKAGGNSIDAVAKDYHEFMGNKDKDLRFGFICNVESKSAPVRTDQELKTLVGEVEVGAGATLKENEKFYFIVQRFDLTDEDIKENKPKSEALLNEIEGLKYIDELSAQNSIESNESMLKKYTVAKQAKLMEKKMPPQQKFDNGMMPGLF